MAATIAQIIRLRRMVAEPTQTVYDDNVLALAIERYPLTDASGYEPDDTNWTATYDLNAAACDVWTEKAAARSEYMDFAADGGSFKQQQQYANALKMARYYAARRMPSSILVIRAPEEATS